MDHSVSPANQADDNPTGIASADMYRASASFLRDLEQHRLQSDGYRLLHVLLHATCRAMPVWSPTNCVQPAEGFMQSCITLRRILGTERANCNRSITQGIEVLKDLKLFDHLNYIHDHHWICWRFSDAAMESIFDDCSYGLFDSKILPTLRLPVDYFLHSQVAIVRRMRKPVFTIHAELVSEILGKAKQPWCDLRSSFMKALRLSAAHHDLTMFVLQKCEGFSRGIDTIEVRVYRRGSIWNADNLSRISTFTRKYHAVHADGVVQLNLNNLREEISMVQRRRLNAP